MKYLESNRTVTKVNGVVLVSSDLSATELRSCGRRKEAVDLLHIVPSPVIILRQGLPPKVLNGTIGRCRHIHVILLEWILPIDSTSQHRGLLVQ
jgi:hypothetical protein